ncbi:DUF4399 domain-containing protein [Alkalimarinus coralli]|uniref:DUF4399 domain-containing protein n=1 Tax=Alkalimarinus coralli TaxID=2935863 RepID=UPI003515D76D
MFKASLSASVLALSMVASSYVMADGHAHAERMASPEGASVYIISPKDGDTVEQTFNVKFGLTGMGVAPAGTEKANTGHHHLLVDGKVPDMNQPLGANVKHFGGGQTESEITLEPGQHTLQLILGDHMHVPHNPPVASEVVTITVK